MQQTQESALQQHKATLEATTQEVTKFQQLFEAAKSEKEYFTEQMKTYYLAQQKEVSDKLTEQIELLATKLSEARTQADELSAKCATFESKLAEKTQIEATLKAELDAINTAKLLALQSATTEEKSAQQLKQELTQANVTITDLTSKVAAMNRSNNFLRDDKRKAEQQIQKLETDMQTMLSNPKQKIHHTMTIKKQNTTLQQEVTELTNQVRRLTSEKKLLEARKVPPKSVPCQHCLKINNAVAGLTESTFEGFLAEFRKLMLPVETPSVHNKENR